MNVLKIIETEFLTIGEEIYKHRKEKTRIDTIELVLGWVYHVYIYVNSVC